MPCSIAALHLKLMGGEARALDPDPSAPPLLQYQISETVSPDQKDDKQGACDSDERSESCDCGHVTAERPGTNLPSLGPVRTRSITLPCWGEKLYTMGVWDARPRLKKASD
ncbi:hypothetical protein F5Y12DRAFT_711475 [Xylaria sp. FL1777]|nr:hypothetical protein F5Y12DRAFT_711475 [Xylaria sp. FL1777]